MKVYCCQVDIAWENKRANHAKVRALIAGAGLAADALLVLPEMFSTGFSMDVATVCEGTAKETEQFLANLAREQGVFVLGGLVTALADGRGRNEAVVFSPQGREIARYSKMQPFTLGGEARQYAAGSAPITFPWQTCVVAPFICYDLRFPEIFRVAARRAPHLFTVIANWPDTRLHHWVRLLQARAIENQAYVAGVNRCGQDPKHLYCGGRTMILDPHGEIIADAGGREGIISADLNLDWLAAYRREFPALADMRKDYVKSGGEVAHCSNP